MDGLVVIAILLICVLYVESWTMGYIMKPMHAWSCIKNTKHDDRSGRAMTATVSVPLLRAVVLLLLMILHMPPSLATQAFPYGSLFRHKHKDPKPKEPKVPGPTAAAAADGDCQPGTPLTGKSGNCNTENGSDCCKDGQEYQTYDCSPPVTNSTKGTLTLNSFAKGGDGGGGGACDGSFYPDSRLVVAMSTGWFDKKSRCKKNIVITANGKSVTAMVVDACDSMNGCDKDHNFEPPCRYNIIDGSPEVWKQLGLNKEQGEAPITWYDASS
ncbi:hypothetical protein ACP4OV_010888 [Aristida adscensionis]